MDTTLSDYKKYDQLVRDWVAVSHCVCMQRASGLYLYDTGVGRWFDLYRITTAWNPIALFLFRSPALPNNTFSGQGKKKQRPVLISAPPYGRVLIDSCDAKWFAQTLLLAKANNYNLWGQTFRFITDDAFSWSHDTPLAGGVSPFLPPVPHPLFLPPPPNPIRERVCF